jgi:hypothetical protein
LSRLAGYRGSAHEQAEHLAVHRIEKMDDDPQRKVGTTNSINSFSFRDAHFPIFPSDFTHLGVGDVPML